MYSPLGNTAVARDEAWPQSWKMSRQHIDLKDIPGGEDGARHRHGGIKPHLPRTQC